MTYDGKLLARARAELEKRREDNRLEQQRRQSAVYARLPELRAIDAQLRAQMAEMVRLTIAKDPGLRERLDELREDNLALQARRAELLRAAGYAEDWLDEIVSCPKCRDSGIYEGGVCSCLEKLYNAELTKELGTLLRQGDECFERFDLSLYPTAVDLRTGRLQRDIMRITFDVCKDYAEDFTSASPNLRFWGGTGLGKTFLSACIARVVAEKGFSVCYESAAAALECYERAKFRRDTEEGAEAARRVRRMEGCDLMILDDLGTEMLTPMSQSALYSLLNRRLVEGRPTIVSTNLDDEALSARYLPQISSRLLGEFKALPFVGEDIRRKRG
ncbi:MAG: ATP-binding protein [Oscillospiraceae bacterium]|nr:ATP-binding protein [Oscillospiraceae bacterium]